MKQQKNPLLLLPKNQSTLFVYLQPHAQKNAIIGMYDDTFLKIQITAPALENKANQALIKFLSQEMDIPKSQIKIISGLKSRYKVLRIDS